MGFMAGKRVLIVGLATERSIAHGIATAMHREGAELAFSYQNERLRERVVEISRAPARSFISGRPALASAAKL